MIEELATAKRNKSVARIRESGERKEVEARFQRPAPTCRECATSIKRNLSFFGDQSLRGKTNLERKELQRGRLKNSRRYSNAIVGQTRLRAGRQAESEPYILGIGAVKAKDGQKDDSLLELREILLTFFHAFLSYDKKLGVFRVKRIYPLASALFFLLFPVAQTRHQLRNDYNWVGTDAMKRFVLSLRRNII